MKTCMLEDCSQKHLAQGYCSMHYTRLRKGTDLSAPRIGTLSCSIPNCKEKYRASGYCAAHYHRRYLSSKLSLLKPIQKRIPTKPCTYAFCERNATYTGYCKTHNYHLKHYGEPKPIRTRHGLVNSAEYRAWCNMRRRCEDTKSPLFKWYGARGIKVCEDWSKSFINFYKDMGPKPNSNLTLDRINNDGDYEPHNCRWVTMEVQARNKRQRKSKLLNKP